MITRSRPWLRVLSQPVTLGAAVICRDERGQVLLVRSRLSGVWGLPGGGVERGEPPAHAASRELLEETGHHGGTAPVLFGLYTRGVGFITTLNVVYMVEGGQIDFRPSFEIREAGWFPPDALPVATHPGVRRRLSELAGSSPISPYW